MIDYNLEEERAARKQKVAIMRHQLERLFKLAERWDTRQDRDGLMKKFRLFDMILMKRNELAMTAMQPIPMFPPGSEKPQALAVIGESPLVELADKHHKLLILRNRQTRP